MRFSLRALTAALLPLAAALPKISRQGKYLYDEGGSRFYIKGVAYQPQGELAQSTEANEANGGFPEPSSFHDPLSSEANCTRDIPFLTQLHVNAVRVYSVNSSLNHDACMAALDAAGIYVLLDVSLPLNGSIDRSAPAWTTSLLGEYQRTIDAFWKYPNVLGFNIGNEVISTANNTNSAPFVKAAARDTKAYLRSIGSNALVGYAAVDGEDAFRNDLAHYFTCGNESSIVDLYGLNNYQWCGGSSLSSSHWDVITQGFEDIPVPTYMSEFGCITAGARQWTEVDALFTAPVANVFSGGMAFSYFPTSDGYGMTEISSSGQITTTDDFTRLANHYANATGPNSPAAGSSTETACPAESETLRANATLPPTPNPSVCECVRDTSFACNLNDATANNPPMVGALIDYACQLLGSSNTSATCDVIGGNGETGSYGPLSMCSPAIKLAYVMSAYWESNPADSSCDFGGNGTVKVNPPNTPQDASDSARKCMENIPADGVSTPTATSGGPSQTTGITGGPSAPSSTGDGKNSAMRLSVSALLVGACGLFAIVA